LDNPDLIVALLIIVTCAFSYKGFKDPIFYESYLFDIDKILFSKDYKRLITTGFLHSGWHHLIFNMLSLLFFSRMLPVIVGPWNYLLIYGASLCGGSLFSLYIHRNHSDYREVGASGAVNGIIFASIALFPEIGISPLYLPLSIPGWLWGLAYLVYSMYGIKEHMSRIGHGAHLGGALVGLTLTIIIYPQVLVTNYLPISLLLVPSLGIIIFSLMKPELLLIGNPFSSKPNYHTLEDKYNSIKKSGKEQLDKLLEKIHAKGINGLSTKERRTLDKLSRKT
jgi:membrane associated rhomboid family serine protease